MRIRGNQLNLMVRLCNGSTCVRNLSPFSRCWCSLCDRNGLGCSRALWRNGSKLEYQSRDSWFTSFLSHVHCHKLTWLIKEISEISLTKPHLFVFYRRLIYKAGFQVEIKFFSTGRLLWQWRRKDNKFPLVDNFEVSIIYVSDQHLQEKNLDWQFLTKILGKLVFKGSDSTKIWQH